MSKFLSTLLGVRMILNAIMLAPDGEGSGGETTGGETTASYDGSGNVTYDNYVVQNQLKDQLDTRMDMLRFCTVDTSLTAQAGDTVKVVTYEGSGDAEDVAEGEGNTGDLSMGHNTKEYTVGTTQARFPYTDEQQMRDPVMVENGIRYLSTAITNDMTRKVVAEFGKATKKVYTGGESTNVDFDDFVDAVALMELKDNAAGGETPGQEVFGLLNRSEKARLQKTLKDDLKYVEAFVRTGYIGTVAGVNLYVNDAIPEKEIVVGTTEAVKYFRKKSPSTETDRDPNKRINYLYGRLVGYAALVDATKLALIVRGAAPTESSGSGD